ncbi:MAG: methyltransferase domain-containing protein [Acidimicrobiales bacterium]
MRRRAAQRDRCPGSPAGDRQLELEDHGCPHGGRHAAPSRTSAATRRCPAPAGRSRTADADRRLRPPRPRTGRPAASDLGAGFGRHAFEGFRRGATAVAVDLARDELVACTTTFAAMAIAGEAPPEATAAAVQGSALALPFADGAFDRIIASEVLEHVVDDNGALTELARVLRPGGTIAVTVPGWLAEATCWKLSDAYHAPGGPAAATCGLTVDVLRTAWRRPGSNRSPPAGPTACTLLLRLRWCGRGGR